MVPNSKLETKREEIKLKLKLKFNLKLNLKLNSITLKVKCLFYKIS